MKRIILIVLGILAAGVGIYACTKTKNTDTPDKEKVASTKTPTTTPPPQTAEQITQAREQALIKENKDRENLGLPPKTDPGPSHS